MTSFQNPHTIKIRKKGMQQKTQKSFKQKKKIITHTFLTTYPTKQLKTQVFVKSLLLPPQLSFNKNSTNPSGVKR